MLKAAIDHSFGQAVQPYFDQLTAADEDRKFAEAEKRLRSSYPNYTGKLRQQILEFAIANGIANIDIAYKAFQGGALPAPAAGPSENPQTSEFETRRARMQQLRDENKVDNPEYTRLKYAEQDAMDAAVTAKTRARNAGDDIARKELLREAKFERDHANPKFGPRANAKPREEMELEAGDLFRKANSQPANVESVIEHVAQEQED